MAKDNNWLEYYKPEQFVMQQGGKISINGYKSSSKDKNEKSLTIPSNRITMAGVDFPVMAYPEVGAPTPMFPGQEYHFPNSSYVNEIPMKQMGGTETSDNDYSYLDQGEEPAQVPHEKQRKYYGRTRNKVDKSLYSPHPSIHKYQVGGVNYTNSQMPATVTTNANIGQAPSEQDIYRTQHPEQHIRPSLLDQMTSQERFQHNVQTSYRNSELGVSDKSEDFINRPFDTKIVRGANELIDKFANASIVTEGTGALKSLIQSGLEKHIAKKAAEQALEELPYSQGFPAKYTTNNPTGITDNPFLTGNIEKDAPLTKEQEILKSHGLDPNKTRISDKKSVIIDDWIKDDAQDRAEYLLDEQIPESQKKSFKGTLQTLDKAKNKPKELITPLDQQVLNAFDNSIPAIDMLKTYSKNKMGGKIKSNWLSNY